MNTWRTVGTLFILGLLPLFGCSDSEEITHYTVPSQAAVEKANPPTAPGGETGTSSQTARDRMLAAMIPHGSQVWFLKLVGPIDAVADQEASFRKLLGSVRFADAEPQWTLPEGWQQLPGSEGRFATLKVKSADGELEVSVTALNAGEDAPAEYTLMNLNRWRGQMSLPPVSPGDLARDTEEIEVDGRAATLVNLVGVFSAGPMMNAPFAGRGS